MLLKPRICSIVFVPTCVLPSGIPLDMGLCMASTFETPGHFVEPEFNTIVGPGEPPGSSTERNSPVCLRTDQPSYQPDTVSDTSASSNLCKMIIPTIRVQVGSTMLKGLEFC